METIFAAHLDPVPPRDTIRDWLDRHKIPRFKSNPTAKRGGGCAYYSVAHVEKMLRTMLSGTASGIRTKGGGK